MHYQKLKNGSLSEVLSILTSLVASGFVAALATSANAQPVAPPPPATPPAVQPTATSYSGTVERYLLNPNGEVDGLLLSNGLEVKFPPHMASSLTATVKEGDGVRVTGTPGVASQFGQEIQAYSITNTRTDKTVVDQPPTRPPQPPVGNGYENLTAEGTLQRWLVGAKGEINGTILSSGTQVKFPPHVGYELTLARRGAKIQAQGFGSRTSYGEVLEATSLTVDGQTIPIQALSSKPLPRPR